MAPRDGVMWPRVCAHVHSRAAIPATHIPRCATPSPLQAHGVLRLPYNCSVDHYLAPPQLLGGTFYGLREASFLRNPRTESVFRTDVLRVRFTRSGEREGGAAGAGGAAGKRGGGGGGGGVVRLPSRPSAGTWLRELSGASARTLHLEDARDAFGSFDGVPSLVPREAGGGAFGLGAASGATVPPSRDGRDAAREARAVAAVGAGGAVGETAVRWHQQAQALLSSWCCTSDVRFQRAA